MDIPIKNNSNLIRDVENNAILGSNTSYEEFIKRRKEKKELEGVFQDMMSRIDDIDNRLQSIERLLNVELHKGINNLK